MTLRARQRFGKYVIERRIAEGGFATVYQARDTIEGIRVALKIPYTHLMNSEALEMFRQEVRLVAALDHPHILPLKYADFINDQFVLVTALGNETLHDRLQRRLSTTLAFDFSRQLLKAVTCAHEQSIIHCDIKPDNLLLFSPDCLKLTDFGIARVAYRTLKGTGSGTLGYLAPEQAMGKPLFSSDVFSIGVVIHEMLTGEVPEWPFTWPMPGYDRLRRGVHPDMIKLLRKSMEMKASQRFADASRMLAAFSRIPHLANRGKKSRSSKKNDLSQTWQSLRWQEFRRLFGKQLETNHECSACKGPVSEAMQACPWCGKVRVKHNTETSFPLCCPRCYRGVKADWSYCGWCFGAGFQPQNQRKYSDKRYTGKCANPTCQRKELMPFMRYCVWCKQKVRKPWKLPGSSGRCPSCLWGVTPEYWTHCPWCAKKLQGTFG
ncbi:serine/threonine-protein kinase [Pirellulales bacterium]|nr:serine/threonine-protein kinase [Pirellulales bacterium]